MFMRKVLTIFLVMAFSITTILPPGYASLGSLRPVSTKIAAAGISGQPRSSINLNSINLNSADGNTPSPSDKSVFKESSAILGKVVSRLFLASNIATLLFLSGCIVSKRDRWKLGWWLLRGLIKEEIEPYYLKLVLSGLFLVVVVGSLLCYKHADARRELEKRGDKKGLKRWKQGAPWVIIIGSILSILASIFSGDDTALAFMIGIAVMVPEKTSEKFLGPNIKITDTDVEANTRFIEPPRDQIEAQLKNGGLAPELFNMSYEAKSSSAGMHESTPLGLQNIDSIPPAISIGRSQRILTAIASQA